MTMPRAKGRKHRIDGRQYFVSVSGGEIDAENNVHLRIAIQADFGHRSYCIVRGVTNRSFWHDYPNVELMRENSISVTPRVVSNLIALAHSEGWNPEVSKSNFELFATRETIRGLAIRQKP